MVLAALERLGGQTTISRLADEVARLRAGDEYLPFDLTQHGHRRAFVDAVAWLEQRGVLGLLDGDTETFVSGTGDALYDVDQDAASWLLLSPPSVLSGLREPSDFLVEAYPPTVEGAQARARHRVHRRLLTETALYYDELPEDERDFARQRRIRIREDLERLSGRTLECRAEGLAVIGLPSGEVFPAAGAVAQAALLFSSELVSSALDDASSTPGGPDWDRGSARSRPSRSAPLGTAFLSPTVGASLLSSAPSHSDSKGRLSCSSSASSSSCTTPTARSCCGPPSPVTAPRSACRRRSMSETVAAPVSRWRPVRAGIRNVWEYDDQVFEFAEGRLVLRGANGSGKSNAPGAPRAVPLRRHHGCEPHGQHGRRPFDEDAPVVPERRRAVGSLPPRAADRVRVARVRPGRGTPHNRLRGRASVQRDAEAWFFVTPMRPDIDLDLTPGGVPLAKSQLADRLGPAAVFESAEAYREAVDRALFGIGRHRYENLLELLIVLRRPHLAGRLNLEQLSKALSDGLAPLDANLIANVAASFEDLEAVQRDLQNLQAAHRSVQSFLPIYTGYLRAMARARALATTDAARAVRAGQRRLARADERLVAVQGQIQLLAEARRATDERREIAEQRHRAVLESPAYRDASSLIEVESHAEDAEQGADRATARGEALKTRAGAAASELREAETKAGHAQSHVAARVPTSGSRRRRSRRQLEHTPPRRSSRRSSIAI